MIKYLTQHNLDAIYQWVISIRPKTHARNTYSIFNQDQLDLCLAIPQHNFFGKELYDSLPKKAEAYFYSIIQYHPYSDGNKRMGLLSLIGFYHLNGYQVGLTVPLDPKSNSVEEDLILYCLRTAQGVFCSPLMLLSIQPTQTPTDIFQYEPFTPIIKKLATM